jgi:predicted N-acetyltransferase YhbS
LPDVEPEITIKQIEPGDKLTGLSLGNPAFTPLKTFLQRHAHKYETQSLARTYAAFTADPKKVVAYITLVCGEIVTGDSDQDLLLDPELDFNYRHYPAVKIARLAVGQKYQKGGLGRTLVNLALGQAKWIICPTVGCRFVVVDSKQESLIFYERCGFTMLDTDENRRRAAPVMWIDLNRVDLD